MKILRSRKNKYFLVKTKKKYVLFTNVAEIKSNSFQNLKKVIELCFKK